MAASDGEAGYVGLKSGQKLRGKGFQTVPPDDRLVVMTPGGAGIGDPSERAPASVRDDVESGLVSSENAVAVYGLPSISEARSRISSWM